MEIYTATGVEMTIAWADEHEYQRGKEFLTNMGANCGRPGDVRKRPEFFYLENNKQLEALFEFGRSLREKIK